MFFKQQKVNKKINIAIAWKAPHKFQPEFPIAALALVIRMVSVNDTLYSLILTHNHFIYRLSLSSTNMKMEFINQRTLMTLIGKMFCTILVLSANFMITPSMAQHSRLNWENFQSGDGKYSIYYLLFPHSTHWHSGSALLDAPSLSATQPSSLSSFEVDFNLTLEEVFGVAGGSLMNH